MHSKKTNCKSQHMFIIVPVTLVLQSLYLGFGLDLTISSIVLSCIMFCIMGLVNYLKTSSYAVNIWFSSIAICAIFSYYILIKEDVTIPIITIIAFQTIISIRVFFISFFIGFISSVILLGYYGYDLALLDYKAFVYMVLIYVLYHAVYKWCCLLTCTKDINIEVLVHDIKSLLSANYNYLSTVKDLFLSGVIKKSKGLVLIDYKKDSYIDLLRFSNLTVDISLKTKNVLRSSQSKRCD